MLCSYPRIIPLEEVCRFPYIDHYYYINTMLLATISLSCLPQPFPNLRARARALGVNA